MNAIGKRLELRSARCWMSARRCVLSPQVCHWAVKPAGAPASPLSRFLCHGVLFFTLVSLALQYHPWESELAHATVGHQLCANDERRLGGCKIKHSARNLLGRTEALERDLGLDTLRDFGELLRGKAEAV